MRLFGSKNGIAKRLLPAVLVLFGLFEFFPGRVSGAGESPRPFTARLPNGMRVVISEDHAVPLVAFQAWVRAGSVNETDATSGTAHLLEHMLFRKMIPPGSEIEKIAEQVESAGGSVNAYTSPERTVVHLVLPSGEWAKGIAAIGEALRAPEFDPRDFEEEKEVVLEEILRSDDIPQSRLMKRLFAESYWVHPYRRPVIGSRDTVAGFEAAELKEFFGAWYRPDRILISVVGDVPAEAVMQKLKEWFSGHPAAVPESVRKGADYRFSGDGSFPAEPPQRGLRRRVERGRWPRARLALAYHTVGIADPLVPPVDLIAAILGDGTGALLKRELEERSRLVHSVDVHSYTPRDPGLIIINAVLDPENVLPALQSILSRVETLRQGGVRNGDVERARAQVIAGYYRDGESREDRAGQLGFLYSFVDGIDYENRYLDAVRTVAVDEIANTARRFLVPDNLTVVVLLPEDSLPGFSEADIDIALMNMTQAVSPGGSVPGPAGAGRLVRRSRAGVKVRYPNGLTLLVQEGGPSGTVAVVSAFPGGLLADPGEKAGMSNLLARLLVRGTDRLGVIGIAEAAEGMGGRFEGFSGLQSLGISADLLSEKWEEGLDLLAEMITRPSLPEAELVKLKEKIAAEIKARDENLLRYAFLLLREELYGDHPYGRDVLGTLDSIGAVTREDLVAFSGALIRPERMVIAVAGGVDEDTVIDRIGELLGGWSPAPVPPDVSRKEYGPSGPGCTGEGSGVCDPVFRGAGTGLRERWASVPGSSQVHLVFGYPGTCFASPDRYPLELVDAILSGQSGRLFRNIRDRKGLAYAVGSVNQLGLDPGFFAVYLATAPDRVGEAIAAVEKELAGLGEGITGPELERAKAYVVGNYRISLGTNAGTASALAFAELYRLGYDFLLAFPEKIERVEKNDVDRAIREFLDRIKRSMVGISAEAR